MFTARGTGNGGQHRNKTDSCVTLIDRKTGTKVRIDGRSQHQNKKIAYAILEFRISNELQKTHNEEQLAKLKDQRGSGMRGDKIRTYRMQDDIVICNKTGIKFNLKKILKGNIEEFLN